MARRAADNLQNRLRNGDPPLSYDRFALAAACQLSVLTFSACRSSAPVVGGATVPVVVNAGDWPGYNRTLAGDRFSPLSEINASNVGQLRTICSYTLPEA